MKHHLSKISIGLMTLGLIGVTALTALAVTRPFHLVEHGTLTVDKDGNLVADGAGTATFSPIISRLTRSGFPGGSASHRESSYLISIVVQHLTPAYEVDVPALFFKRARSLAESQAETARYREALRQKEFNEEKRSQ